MSLFNDGTFQVGSRTLTINGVTYIAENFAYDEPIAKTENVTDQVGDPSGTVAWAGTPTGTATLQMSGTQAVPTQGITFVTTIRGSSTTFYITTVGAPESAQDRKKVNIAFIKKLN